MDNLFKKFFASSILTSVVLLILGVLLIFQSEITIISISYIIGGVLVALGALGIFKFIQSMNNEDKEELNIVYGVVTIILGVLVISNPQAIASFLPIVIGIGIIINSATKLQYALELKLRKNDLWKSTLIVAIISTIFGLLLLFNPFKGAQFIAKIIGILITIYAALDIVSTLSIKKSINILSKTFEEKMKDTSIDAVIIEENEAELLEKNESTDSKEDSKKTKKKTKEPKPKKVKKTSKEKR